VPIVDSSQLGTYNVKTVRSLADRVLEVGLKLPSLDPQTTPRKQLAEKGNRIVAALRDEIPSLVSQATQRLKRAKYVDYRPPSKQISTWLRLVDVVSALAPGVAKNLQDPEVWVPLGKEGNEWTTPQLDEAREDLEIIRGILKDLRWDLNQEWKRLEVVARRLKNEPPKVKVSNEPVTTGKSRGRKTFKQNEWQGKFLKDLLFKRQEEEEKVAPKKPKGQSAEITQETVKSYRPTQGHLESLGEEERAAVICHTVVTQGWFSSPALKVFNTNPFCYEVDYVGGANYEAAGLGRYHEKGYVYFREALLLATKPNSDPHKEIAIMANQDPDWEFLQHQTKLYPEPVRRKSTYYWLLLPRQLESFSIDFWHLVE
jgi:anaerobic selenocysteine-containing dehydrogenase